MANKVLQENDFGTLSSFKNGNIVTKLSAILFGLGNFCNKQIGKGLAFLTIEVAYIYYMVTFGIGAIGDFITLGTREQEEVFNEKLQIYEYVTGDNSMLCLLYGVVTLFVTVGFLIMMAESVKSAYFSQYLVAKGKSPATFFQDMKSLKNDKLHVALLAVPMSGVILFTIVPLVFMIFIAFTNYDKEHLPPGNLFQWIGIENFINILDMSGQIGSTFMPVLIWTFVWAVLATVTNYFLGMILALVINRKNTKWKAFWRFNFMLSIAIPSFVSLLTMRTLFSDNGAVNVLLRDLGVIGITESYPFWTDGTIAKVMIVLINIWIGVPFTMLNHTGILQNIPGELYEAADVEGAGEVAKFFKITLPYMLFITAPYLITTFIGNINNFNVIYLLTGGAPNRLDYYYAGETDLLVTWLYKLTITEKDYKMGSVIGIMIFIISAVFSLITYRHTAAYKDEEGLQ
ncbi:MAG: sugar ABC transporter permease [Eubacteriales bacterium]